MDRFHGYYCLHQLLNQRNFPVSRRAIEQALECSPATVKRVIEELRNYGAPIEYVREDNGYRYVPDQAFELPGIWFSPSELEAMLVAQDWLAQTEPSLLSETLEPLKRKLTEVLAQEHLGEGELPRRVRILRMAGRGTGRHFNRIAQALIERKRMSIEYHGRIDNTATRREISPQRLVHYRDNWYLDAWCHLRKGLRSFAVERIREAKLRGASARDIPDSQLDEHFATAYGIFAGTPTHIAVLRFTPERARWVAEEEWHPRQEGRFLADGSFELRVPYADERELVMDILRHGDQIEVLAPTELRGRVQAALEGALRRYRGGITD